MRVVIETGDLIQQVRLRPCLYDRRHPSYKLREERKLAWIDIAKRLCPQYDDVYPSEQKEIVRKMHQRWKSARDIYRKTMQSEATYSHSASLAFLDDVMDEAGGAGARGDHSEEGDSAGEEYVYPNMTVTSSNEAGAAKKRKAETQSIIVERLRSGLHEQRLESEDLSFFNSLGPALSKFSTLQKMVFRTRVMQVIMDMESATSSVAENPALYSLLGSPSSSHDNQQDTCCAIQIKEEDDT